MICLLTLHAHLGMDLHCLPRGLCTVTPVQYWPLEGTTLLYELVSTLNKSQISLEREHKEHTQDTKTQTYSVSQGAKATVYKEM